MTPQELTQRAVHAYNGQQWGRATCLFLMALLAEREPLYRRLADLDVVSRK